MRTVCVWDLLTPIVVVSRNTDSIEQQKCHFPHQRNGSIYQLFKLCKMAGVYEEPVTVIEIMSPP